VSDTTIDQLKASPGPARGKRPITLAIGVLIVLLAAGTWFVVLPTERAKIAVSWSGSLECSGTHVTHEQAGDQTVETMLLRPAMRCHRSFTVENDGWLPVTITSVRLPFMAPTNHGPPVQVTEFDGLSPQKSDTDGSPAVDALFLAEHKVPAGSFRKFTIAFVYRPGACMSDGLMWSYEFPAVTIQMLVKSVLVVPREAIGFRTDPATGAKANCSE
jgi:hypothetical protein